MTQKERRIIVRPQPRTEPDLRRLARCIIELAIETTEAEDAAVSRSSPPADEEAA